LLVLGPFQQYFISTPLRLLVFWLFALAASLFLYAWAPFPGFASDWGKYLATSTLLSAFCFKVASFLPEITPYPFSLSWSEASRYYYASLYLSKQIYGINVPPTVLHPTRYLMQSLPYLIPSSPLWLHRAWQVFLWLSITLLTAALLVRRLDIRDRVNRWLLVVWAFLFLLVGPVYYHLQVTAIIILAFYHWDHRRKAAINFLASLVVVLLASMWAGISRINWMPVPGMLAAALYFLETPLRKNSDALPASLPTTHVWRKLSVWLYPLAPLTWTLAGMGAALATQALYIQWSGN